MADGVFWRLNKESKLMKIVKTFVAFAAIGIVLTFAYYGYEADRAISIKNADVLHGRIVRAADAHAIVWWDFDDYASARDFEPTIEDGVVTYVFPTENGGTCAIALTAPPCGTKDWRFVKRNLDRFDALNVWNMDNFVALQCV